MQTPLLDNSICFFFNDTATTEIYTLSLHDALPIFPRSMGPIYLPPSLRKPSSQADNPTTQGRRRAVDWKSTRLNSSHDRISYAVLWLQRNMETLLSSGLDRPRSLRSRVNHRVEGHH